MSSSSSTVRLSRDGGPGFPELWFVGLRPPDSSVFLDLAFVCDDAPVWVNRAVSAATFSLIWNIVAMHECCGCRGSRCVSSSSEVRIILPGVRSAELEKVLELAYTGIAIVDSVKMQVKMRDLLTMLAMKAAFTVTLKDDGIGGGFDFSDVQEDVGEEAFAQTAIEQENFGLESVSQGNSLSESKRKRKRSVATTSIADEGELRRSKVRRASEGYECDEEDDSDGTDDQENNNNGLGYDSDDANDGVGSDSDDDDEEDDNYDLGNDTDDEEDDINGLGTDTDDEDSSDWSNDTDYEDDEDLGNDTDRLGNDSDGFGNDTDGFGNDTDSLGNDTDEEEDDTDDEDASEKVVRGQMRPFRCQKCEYSAYVRRHVEAVHDKIKKFKCARCNYFASQTLNLKRNASEVH